MKEVRRLLAAVRAISPYADVRLLQVPYNQDMWVVQVAARDVVLVETSAGLIEVVIPAATKKIETMSQRMMAAVRDDPPSSEK